MRTITALGLCGCCDCEKILNLENFAGTAISRYPVGVFNIDGNFLGIANDAEAYALLWNADASDQAAGQIDTTFDPFGFKVVSGDGNINTLIGMNFYTVTFSGNNEHFYTGLNKYYVANGVLGNSNSGTTISSDTSLAFKFDGINWHVPAFNMQDNAPTSTAGNPIYLFDNSQTNGVFSHDVFSPIVTLSGNFPLNLVHFGVRSLGVDIPNVTTGINWGQLSLLQTFVILNLGGGGFKLFVADVPNNLPSNLRNLLLCDLVETEAMYTFTWLTATNYPNMQNLLLKSNAGANFATYNATWWSNLPKCPNLISIIGMTGGNALSASVSDSIWNQLAVNLASVVPTGDKKILQVQDSSAATAASLTARNNLTAAGWTVLLT